MACQNYELLPSDQHRMMFLDAALIMHDCPVAHLTTVWSRIMLARKATEGRDFLQRKDSESIPAWNNRQHRAAHRAAEQHVADLCDAGLVNVEYSGETKTPFTNR